MYAKHAEFKAGIVVVLALAALLVLLFAASGESLWASWRTVHVRFEQGRLAPEADDPVFLDGVKVGRVTEVALRVEERRDGDLTARDREALGLGPGDPGAAREVYVHALLRIAEGTPLPRGTKAVIRESLTGSVELDLVPGRSPEDLADGDTEREPIPGHQAPGLSDLSEQAGRIVAKVDRIADEGVLLMGDARGLVAALARKVEAVDTAGISRDAAAATAALKRTLEGLETRIDEIAARVVIASEDLVRMGHAGAQAFEQFEQDAAAFMASLKAAAEKIDTMVGKADPKVQAFLDSLVVAGRDLASLVKQFEGLGPEARGLVASVGGSVDRLTDTLDDAFHNLVDATEEIKSRPWILLNEPDTEEIAFDNIRIASTNYAKAAGEVREAAREIKDLLARPDAGSESVRRLLQEAVARFESSRDRYRTVEDELMRLLKGAPPGR